VPLADQLRDFTAARRTHNETRRNDNAGRELLQCLDVMKECALDEELFLDPMGARIAFEQLPGALGNFGGNLNGIYVAFPTKA
jgi:hypothetical protein